MIGTRTPKLDLEEQRLRFIREPGAKAGEYGLFEPTPEGLQN